MITDMQTAVLNPVLFDLLQARFGRGNVKIIAQGEAMSYHVEERPPSMFGSRSTRMKQAMVVDHQGEEYSVNCPFCRDTRQRLTINHRYATWNDQLQTRLTWLFRCYNEECQQNHQNRQALFEELFTYAGQAAADNMDQELLPGNCVDDTDPVEIDPPGEVIPLNQLPVHHPAVQYMSERLFDVNMLATRYQVGYCPKSHYRLAENRIIIPLLNEGKWFGWQARFIGDADYKAIGEPKYWTAPGTKRGKIMYNFDVAIKHQTVVIVEGPADVWGFGPQATGCWGHSMSYYNRQKLVESLREDATVVVLLDPKPDAVAVARGKPHHIEKLYQQLLPSLQGRLIRVHLPDVNSDPGSLDRKFMRNVIRAEADRVGVPICFNRDF